MLKDIFVLRLLLGMACEVPRSNVGLVYSHSSHVYVV